MDRGTSRNVVPRTPLTPAGATVPPRISTEREGFSRVPCRYFNTPKGCYWGNECRFSHDIAAQDTLSITSTDVTDHLSSQCSETPSSSSADPRTAPTHVCGICFERPEKYGLLANCSHVFFCIRKWRSREGKSEETLIEEMHKTCPICRKHSDLVIPSSTFYEHSTPEKQTETQKYLSSMSKIPCRHFSQSPTYARSCPFGNECHYAHNVNGRRYIFSTAELTRIRVRREERAIRRNAEAMLGELMAQEAVFGMDENEAFVWDILHGLIEHERHDHHHRSRHAFRHDWFDDEEDVFGLPGYDPSWSDEDDDDDDEDEDDDDDDDDDDESEDDSDVIPDLIDDDMPELVDDDLPDLIDDEIPDLVDDQDLLEAVTRSMNDVPPLIDDDLPPLIDDDLPPLVDDDLPPLIDDDLPPLIDDDLPPLIDDDIPDLIDDDIPELVDDIPNPRTRTDFGPTNAQRDEYNRRPQVFLNSHQAASTRPAWGPTNAEDDFSTRPRIILTPRLSASRRQSEPSAPQVQPQPRPVQSNSRPPPRVSHRIFESTPPTTSTRTTSTAVPASRLRRFTPPRHIPPPGPRRPRPPRSRNRDTSRPRYAPRVARPPPPTQDDVTWDDDEGTTDGEVSEREKQRIRESEERGINARNWDSRARDLSSFFHSQ